jgi:hypothetical protein
MDIHKVIAELRAERDCLDEVLILLERLMLKRTPRRGRPPLWMKLNNTTLKVEEVSEGAIRRHRRGEKMANSGNS